MSKDGAHVALIDELARWPGPKLGSRASGHQMMARMGQALVGTVTCTLRPICIKAGSSALLLMRSDGPS